MQKMNNEDIKETKRIQLLGIVSLLLLSLLVGMIWFYMPQYQVVFSMLPERLSVGTQMVIKTYKFWVILPIMTLFVFIKTFGEEESAKLSRMFSLLLLLGMGLLVLFYMAVVSPIEAQAVDGEIIIPLTLGTK